MTRDDLETLLPPTAPRGAGTRRKHLDAVEDYLFVRGDRMTSQQAADRLGVCRRTVQRYRATLRGRATA